MSEIRRVARTSSTQDEVRRAARAGAAEWYCCVADEQTAGRGRLGRSWVAPPGAALLASVLLRPHEAVLTGLPFAAGLAVLDALQSTCGLETRLKWPNDVVAAGGKLAGLLVEIEPAAALPERPAAVLGLGLNRTVDRFPDGVAGASLHLLTTSPPSREALLTAWLDALSGRAAALESDGVAATVDAWREHATGLGQPASVSTPAGATRGIAEDVDSTGALLLRTPHELIRVVAGDVQTDTASGSPQPSRSVRPTPQG